MPDPLAEWLRPGPVLAPEPVAAALVRALLPPEAPDRPPRWLRPDQRLSFARAVAAVREYGGALLADPVGSGKSFIGMAVAATVLPAHPIHVLAPASLLDQWQRVARQIGVPILAHSHELLSRGRLPSEAPGFVLLDESQRFRTPATRRYETLAPWCVGRVGLLLSATPVVNRMEELAQQLRLLVRDDALAWAGLGSLDRVAQASGDSALARLVITGEDRSASLPATLERAIRVEEPLDSACHALRAGILALELSRNGAIAALVRSGLLLALASSPAAIALALARYRSLLQHARDAVAARRLLSRQTIRRIVGAATEAREQLVFWELVAEGSEPLELALEDLPAVLALETAARAWSEGNDAKVNVLRRVLTDGSPSLVFTQSPATVRYLRRRLGGRIAWCTGGAAGLDGQPLPRDEVLGWFRAPAALPERSAPVTNVLLATDVAAEGLDLPRLTRVVHYDLPWTAVRLEQRSGRARRLTSQSASLEVVRLLPSRSLDALLGQEGLLERKAGLPLRLGLAQRADAPWRVRARLAERWAPLRAERGVALLSGGEPGLLVGVRLVLADGTARTVVLARSRQGWHGDLPTIEALLERAYGNLALRRVAPHRLRAALRAVAAPLRAILRALHAQPLTTAVSEPARRLVRRILPLSREAVRRRDPPRIAAFERGLRFLRRGHTAGETRQLTGWLALPSRELVTAFERLPAEPARQAPVRIELVGMLLVEASRKSR